MIKDIQKIISRIEKLPTLPHVVTQIMTIVQDPHTSAKDLNKVISQDQALASKVLKLVNSAFYGFPRRITSITQATIILGFNTVKTLALSASVFDVFANGTTETGFNRNQFWVHSIGTGICCQLLAKYSKVSYVEEAFLAGILHDIGKVVEDQYVHSEFVKVMEVVKTEGISIREAEQKVLQVDHTLIGGWLVQNWKFPLIYVDSINYHHDPLRATNAPQLAALVHYADIICKQSNIGNSGDNVIPKKNDEALIWLNIKDSDLDLIHRHLNEEIQKTEAFLDLTIKEGH